MAKRENKPKTRRHRMPFGAEIREGGVIYRLWAPDVQQVHLCVQTGSGDERLLAMEQPEPGWFQYFDKKSGAGSRYSFQINNSRKVPDPASRYQPDGVHRPSMVIDPLAWPWQDGDWGGRPIEEAVFYELHVGSFSPEGNYAGIEERLEYFAELGITALQLMPIAAFAGCRNWGYDGVLPFAPTACYGPPELLKSLVDAAHRREIMVFLDVVYNHFGPEGNYLNLYASPFFTDRYRTPWGKAIRFSGTAAHWVRRYFIENGLYWLEEYHLDGLRLDAVHTIIDPSDPNFLMELAAEVRSGPGRERQVHLILENYDNKADLLERDQKGKPRYYSAQWNDDMHHALHIMLTGETDGYYVDYADRPLAHLGRCLTEGFAYQGEKSIWLQGKKRGSPSRLLPASAFVNFMQNHDQIGNRAFGERLTDLTDAESLSVLTAVLLLAPQLPMLFMGQEWGCRQPFFYFCDFSEDLAKKVREGRRNEFDGFAAFRENNGFGELPDPCGVETFKKCVLDWNLLQTEEADQWLTLHRKLLEIRHKYIIPRLSPEPIHGSYEEPAAGVIRAIWQLTDLSLLVMYGDFGKRPISFSLPGNSCLYCSSRAEITGNKLELKSWSVAFFLQEKT